MGSHIPCGDFGWKLLRRSASHIPGSWEYRELGSSWLDILPLPNGPFCIKLKLPSNPRKDNITNHWKYISILSSGIYGALMDPLDD